MTTVARGDVLPDVPHFGGALPLGTEVSNHRNSEGYHVYLNEVPQTWTRRGIDDHWDWYVLSQPLYLRSDTEIVLPQETAREFRWRLRDSALGAAERSGVNIGAVRDMCREFGAGEPLLRVGGTVQNATDLKTLPSGSQVYLGHPDKPDLLQVWEIDEYTNMVNIFGGMQSRPAGAPVVIHSIPGVVEAPQAEAPVSEVEWANIAMRAWQVGKVYKNRQGWCGVFEYMLQSLGITAESVKAGDGTITSVGETVDKETAAKLPEGSILFHKWRTDSTRWAMWIRDDSATNKARTRLLVSRDAEESSHDVMTVAYRPDATWLLHVEGHMMAQMPNGVMYRRYGYNDSQPLTEERRQRLISYHTYSITGWPA